MKKFYTLSVILFLGINAFSANEKITISLNKAIELSFQNNKDIKISIIRQQESYAKIAQAWGDLIPTIESNASATRQGAETGFISLSDGSYDIRIIQATLSVNPGVFTNSLKIAFYENLFNSEEYNRIKYQVLSDTIKAYFSVIRANELIKTRKDSQLQLLSNLNDVNNLYKMGSVPKLELLQAEIQYKNISPLIKEAENLMRTSEDSLNFVIGSDIIRYTANIDSINEPNKLKNNNYENTIEVLTQIALKNRPEIIELDIREKQAEHLISVQRSLYLWPTFFAQANYGFNKNIPNTPSAPSATTPQQAQLASMLSQSFSTISGDDKWQKTWQVRIGAIYRWNGFMPFDKISQKQKEESLKKEEINLYLQQLRQAVSNSIRRNFLLLRTSSESLSIRKETIATAEEGLRIAKESYHAGIIKNSDLLSAESNLSSAKAAYIDSLYLFYSSLADLAKETGNEISSILFVEE